MKKSILLLTFLNKYNYLKTKHSSCFVYRHLSSISLSQINALTKKLNVDLNKLCSDIFSIIASAYFKNNQIIILSKHNKEHILKLNYSFQEDESLNQIKNELELLPIIQSSDVFDKLSLKFELKIVKGKVLLSYFYTDDFFSKEPNSKIIHDYEKLLRKLIRTPFISIKELIKIISNEKTDPIIF